MTTASAAATGLHRRRLALARAIWLVVVGLVVGLTLADIPFEIVNDQVVCSGSACPAGQLSPAVLAQLQQAGIAPSSYAVYSVAGAILSVLPDWVIAALIFWRKADDGFGVFSAIALVLFGFVTNIAGPPLPAIAGYYPALAWLIQLLGVAGWVASFAFIYLFPDGRFAPRWMGWLLPLVLVGNILVFLHPEGWGAGLFFFLEALSALFAIIYKYARASNAIQRQQTKWVVYGSSLAWLSVLGLIVLTGILYPAGQPAGLPTLVLNTAWSLGMLFFPLSLGIAILRSHLWDIDILIRRTLVYTSLTAILALVYFACVIVLQSLLTLITRQSSTAVEVVSTLAIAAAFFPLRRRIQSFIERRFYRNQYDAAKTLATFAATARDETDLDQLAERLVSVVEETMQPETAGLWLRSPTDSRQPPASGGS